jgi:SET domain-containing protein
MPERFSVTRGLALRQSRIHGRGVYAREPDDPDAVYHTFLFSVDDETVIDAAYRGNIARWINHSCDPNCEAVDEDGRIFIESVRDIAAGEELAYDYHFILEVRHSPAMKRRYPCICGAPSCRGTMLAKKR